jgi:recombination protein RecA
MSSDLLAHLKKTYKTNVFNHNDLPSLQMVSTGIATLDLALGGGLAVGRVAELFGPESAGKSTICLSICRAAVNRGETALYIDLEKTVTKEAIAAHGLDNEQFIVTRPNYSEDAIDQLIESIKMGAKLVILDTVAMLMPKAVYDKIDNDSEARDVSSTAGFLNRVKNKITDQVEHNQAVVVFVNQVRDNLNSTHGGLNTPGGHAIKHLYSQRIRVTHSIKDLNSPGRIKSQIKIEKNKCATPYLSCEVPIYNGVAQTEECLILAGEQLGVVRKSGAWYYLEPLADGMEQIKLQGSANAAKYLKDNPGYTELLYARLTDQINKNNNGDT